MRREDIENAVYEESHKSDFQFKPWSNQQVINFAIQIHDRTLEDAATIADPEHSNPSNSSNWQKAAIIRGRKIMKEQLDEAKGK